MRYSQNSLIWKLLNDDNGLDDVIKKVREIAASEKKEQKNPYMYIVEKAYEIRSNRKELL